MDTYNIIKIHNVISTSDYVLSLKSSKIFREGLVVVSDFQQKGRGQRGKYWQSEFGKNLLISVVIKSNILIKKKFDISKFVSLSVIDCLSALGVTAHIKWPNDILVGSNKISGILIDNIISKNTVKYSVVGIGLNINQANFNLFTTKATSLKLELKKSFSLVKIQNLLLDKLRNRLVSYRNSEFLDIEYLDYLYKKDKIACFEANFTKFNGIIRGVTDDGRLKVELDSSIQYFDVKEIKMLF